MEPKEPQGWVALGQTSNREEAQPHSSADSSRFTEHRPAHQSKNEVFTPPVSPSHQEAYTSLVTSSTQGQAEETRRTTISQQPKQEPHYRKVIRMSDWTTAMPKSWFLLSCSVVSDSLAISQTSACQASMSFTVSWSLLKLMSIESMRPSNHLILCHPLLLLPSFFPNIWGFSSELALGGKWPKYCSNSISASSEDSGLISFRMDWLGLCAVQRTLSTLLQHHSSDASVLRCSAFFMVQFWHPHMTTGKIIALTCTGRFWQSNVSAF